jgi:lysophospholipase L1-like esterase
LGLGCAIAVGSPAIVSVPAEPSEPVRLRDEQIFLTRYREDNARLKAAHVRVNCVFMGDSITERWLSTRPAFFRPDRVCRGIIGQTTLEMLLRFRADVVQLGPAVVHIMAGTNDIAGNTGSATPTEIAANIMSMTELALANGIRVVIASVPPAARYSWRPGARAIEPTRELNTILTGYAARIGAVYADYYSRLSDGKGGMLPGFAINEVHPTDTGYQAMEPIAEKAIEKALKSPQLGLRAACCNQRVSQPDQFGADGLLFGAETYGAGTEADSVVLSGLGWPPASTSAAKN